MYIADCRNWKKPESYLFIVQTCILQTAGIEKNLNLTLEPIQDIVDARRRSLWIRTVRTSWCTQSGCWWCGLSFRFGGKLYLDKFSVHLHEVKQAETVHHKLLLFITTQLDVLVQPAPLRFPATAEFALVFALPCRAIPCWEPDS